MTPSAVFTHNSLDNDVHVSEIQKNKIAFVNKILI